MSYPYELNAQDAPRIWEWIRDRGGIAIWQSINLSNPAGRWTTPAKQLDGSPTTKPTWQAGNDPLIITDPAQVTVYEPKEIRRFRVAVRIGGNGLQLKLTHHAGAKVRQAVERAGEGAYYQFDYLTQEAVIYKAVKSMSLPDWHRQYSQERAQATA